VQEPDALSNVSRETISKLRHFEELVLKWTKSINLISSSSVGDIWQRHIQDSAQIFNLAGTHWSSWTDIGSGGGFPGLVIAILEQDNKRRVTLIESDQRKCLFLNTVRRELDLSVQVVQKRIENAEVAAADILSARALAPLKNLIVHSRQLMKPNGRALFPKGARYKEELDQAAVDWQFDVTAHPSQTNTESRILEISGIQRRES